MFKENSLIVDEYGIIQRIFFFRRFADRFYVIDIKLIFHNFNFFFFIEKDSIFQKKVINKYLIVEKHQQFQEKIIDLQNEVAVENQKIVGLVEELKKVEENLTETLDQAKIRLDVVKRARESIFI